MSFGAKVEQEKSWPQVLAILICALAGMTNGFFYSWNSPFLIKIVQDKVNYHISEEEASNFNTIFPISMALTAPMFSKLPDIIGRKKTILLISIPQVASWLCSAFAKSKYVFYIARALGGISDAIFFVSVPIYIGEISNPIVRGTWGNLVASSYYLGEFVINALGSYFGVRETSFICLPIPILFFVLFSMMPESPYYYLIQGDEENAKKSLIFLKRTKNVEIAFNNLKSDVKRQMSESATWLDLIKIKSNRKALLAGGLLRFGQQMSGLLVFISYTQFIFQKSGGNMTHQLSSMIFFGLQMCLNLLVLLFVINRFGRRTCVITSSFFCALILFVIATFYYIDGNTTIDISNLSWFPIASTVVFQIFASFGISVIPTLMLSELFSASIKSKAMMIMVIFLGLGNFFNNYVFYLINTTIGFFAPFYLFAVCNTFSAILFYILIPETKGKTLEEIQQSLKGKSV